MTLSVTFDIDLGGSGRTFTDDDNPASGMWDLAYIDNFFPLLSDVLALGGFVRDSAVEVAANKLDVANNTALTLGYKNAAAASAATAAGYAGVLDPAKTMQVDQVQTVTHAKTFNAATLKSAATDSENPTISQFFVSASGNTNELKKASIAYVRGTFNKVTEFTSSGTFTKSATSTFLLIEAWGAGGGGGSGRRGAAASNRAGGTGGGGGGRILRLIKASDVGSSETVTIGTGGTGGTAISVDSTNGNAGNNGGNTTFGSLFTAFGGKGGSAGDATTNVVGGNGGGGISSMQGIGGHATGEASGSTAIGAYASDAGGASGGTCTQTGATGGGNSITGGRGGGGGSHIPTSNTVQVAGAGGGVATGTASEFGAGGAAGASLGQAGTAGTSSVNGGAGTGGGGGYAGTAQAAGAGGAGGRACGGGGGGPSLNGFNSGAGGAGGNGYLRVCEF